MVLLEVELDTVVNQTHFHAQQEPQDRYRQGVQDHGVEVEVQESLTLGIPTKSSLQDI